jgi:hypothetical protein
MQELKACVAKLFANGYLATEPECRELVHKIANLCIGSRHLNVAAALNTLVVAAIMQANNYTEQEAIDHNIDTMNCLSLCASFHPERGDEHGITF